MSYDLCVIGAGAGGLTTAAFAANMGAKVVLIEREEMGGDCLNWGCVPSKALLASAHRHESFEEAMEHVKRAIKAIAPHDSVERFEGLGVRVIMGEASFTSHTTLIVNGETITAKRFVIATGTRAFVPDGLPAHLTHKDIFQLTTKPEHLLIIGAGAIGVEMAQAFAQLNCKVTLLARRRILPHEDEEAALIIKQLLEKDGVEVLENTTFAQQPHSHMLVAAGRVPNVESLNLDVAGVTHTHKGIMTDKALRTRNKRIYTAGDIAGRDAFTHAAGHMGAQVAQQILFGKPFDISKSLIPHCIYTSLEVASVGMVTPQCLKANLEDNDRAVCENNPQGFVKIYHEKGVIKGAVIVGKGAGEMISLYTLAIQKRMKLVDIAGVIMPYPTLSEAGKSAVGEYFRAFSNNRWLRLFVKWKLKLS